MDDPEIIEITYQRTSRGMRAVDGYMFLCARCGFSSHIYTSQDTCAVVKVAHQENCPSAR